MKSINQHTGFILPWREMKFFYRSILYPYRVTLSIGGAGAGGERGREGGRQGLIGFRRSTSHRIDGQLKYGEAREVRWGYLVGRGREREREMVR